MSGSCAVLSLSFSTLVAASICTSSTTWVVLIVPAGCPLCCPTAGCSYASSSTSTLSFWKVLSRIIASMPRLLRYTLMATKNSSCGRCSSPAAPADF